jgi:hypothetical protein
MVRFMLCKCIQILAQVSEGDFLLRSSIVSQTVAAWSPGVTWTLSNGDYAAYYAIQSPSASNIISETALYSIMKNVSSNGAISNLPQIISALGCEYYIQGI